MRSRRIIFNRELINLQGQTARDVDIDLTARLQFERMREEEERNAKAMLPPPPPKPLLPQIAVPPLQTGMTPIEEVRTKFLKGHPGIKHVGGIYYEAHISDGKSDPMGRRRETMGLEKWFEYLKASLNEVQQRCNGRLKLPPPPMRSVYGLSSQTTIQWEGCDNWAPDLKQKINHIERYYTTCREFEMSSAPKPASSSS